MKRTKKFSALLLAGAMGASMLFAGCSGTENVPTQAGGIPPVENTTVQSAESETRPDGSIIRGNTYHDKLFAFTMTLPKGWKDGVYIFNTQNESGNRQLDFVEKKNYDKNKALGRIFSIAESEKEANGEQNISLGSIVNSSGNRVYLTLIPVSDVQYDMNSKKLKDSYLKLYKLRDKAIDSIVIDAAGEYEAPKAKNSKKLKSAQYDPEATKSNGNEGAEKSE